MSQTAHTLWVSSSSMVSWSYSSSGRLKMFSVELTKLWSFMFQEISLPCNQIYIHTTVPRGCGKSDGFAIVKTELHSLHFSNCSVILELGLELGFPLSPWIANRSHRGMAPASRQFSASKGSKRNTGWQSRWHCVLIILRRPC